FWSLPLYVDQRVLIPRPATECLVEAILELPLATSAHVVDLGAGSGAIALALACERQCWHVTATDRSPGALQVVRRNIDSLLAVGKLKRAPLLMQANWLGACAGSRFDLVVANPPYIAQNDAHLQCGDLRFEPLNALASGEDGFSDLFTLCRQAQHCLKAGGYLALEHGYTQQAGLVAIIKEQQFEVCAKGSDLAGQPRFVIAQKIA
ncbi:MAG: peptide chain release factor N(5)-glutamine methyltransferase, partial [Gammaproteobacteria bacterium]|nr:peptide chain release factor N(5)-glutamine methyltransferase [Gammaproteobacteria bacterium]